MLEIFNFLNHIKQQLSGIEECRVIARVGLSHVLEIEVYFPVLDYHIAHAYDVEELRAITEQKMFTSIFINKIGDAVEAFKKAQS